METAEEARNAPCFEASVHAPGLLAALQFNPFVPTQEEFSVMTEKHTHTQPPAGKSGCLLCYFLVVPIKRVVENNNSGGGGGAFI